MAVHEQPDKRRKLFMVLSPQALPYAILAFKGLFLNAVEQVHLSVITDTDADKQLMATVLSELPEWQRTDRHSWIAYSASDLDEFEQHQFSGLSRLHDFRRGHPCWRKITDPLLLSAHKQEMIVLDPDIYFPNRFRFEPTPETGVLLMWQKPSCLFPPEIVTRAMNAGIPLAHHIDIGVAQWRAPVDLEWLDWLLGQLGSPELPRSMHVEAIVWAALAMRIGGGHLDRRQWLCWHRTQYNRLLRKLGASGTYILRRERLTGVKCFHAGGEAKWWLPEAHTMGILDRNDPITESGSIQPFTEFTPQEFHTAQRNRRWLRRLGYYSLFRQDLGAALIPD
jgi:hypothetical protein